MEHETGIVKAGSAGRGVMVGVRERVMWGGAGFGELAVRKRQVRN